MSRSTLMISAQLPSRTHQETAGEQLALRYVDFWESRGDFLLVSGAGPANLRARERGQTPPHLLLDDRPGWLSRMRARLLTVHPIFPSQALRRIPDLERAEVIDLQWQEQGWLLPGLRRAAPHARITITLHDVLSQRFERRAAASRTRRHRPLWMLRTAMMRRLERSIMRLADDVIVLSDKDCRLLPSSGRARVHVIPPPAEAPLSPAPSNAGTRLLFVGYLARRENHDAAQLLIEQILPRIRQQVPDAQLTLIGKGLDPELARKASEQNVRVMGFVEDLEPEYAQTNAVIAPLREGAGVKLKVVEAMMRGLPVITTSVGIEGIPHGPGVAVADSSDELADAAVQVLQQPHPARSAARSQVPVLKERFGLAAFVKALEEIHS